MDPKAAALIADRLNELLASVEIKKIYRPDRWSLGLGLARNPVLGLCWFPESRAVGFCEWRWPRGAAEDILKARLKNHRIDKVESVQGEPIIRIRFSRNEPCSLLWENLGRSSNIYLLDFDEKILWSGRILKGRFRTGETGSLWLPPPPQVPPVKSDPDWNTDKYLNDAGGKIILHGLLERGRRASLTSLIRKRKSLKQKKKAILRDIGKAEEWIAMEGPGRALISSEIIRKRGLTSKDVVDYTVDPPKSVRLTLDPSKTVQENAESIFAKVRRGKRRLEKAPGFLRDIDGEIERLADEEEKIQTCVDLGRLYPEGQRKRVKRKQAKRSLPQDVARVELPLGFAGYAGKSARGNDRVSFIMGRGSDFWLHAEDYPGCHVVVKNPDRLRQLPPKVEEAAARYAANNSGAPEGRTAVILTQVKFLGRVRAAPGKVTISSHRTVFIDR